MSSFETLDKSHNFFKISSLICQLLSKLNHARGSPQPVPTNIFRHGRNIKHFPEFSSVNNAFPIVLPFSSLSLSEDDFPNAIKYPDDHVFWSDEPTQATSSTLKRAADRLDAYTNAKQSEVRALKDFECKKAKLVKAQAELPILIKKVEEARAVWEAKKQTTQDIEQAFHDGEVISATFDKVQPDIPRSKFCVSLLEKYLDIKNIESPHSSNSDESDASPPNSETGKNDSDNESPNDSDSSAQLNATGQEFSK